ncbi:MAG: hypothetical protein HYW97_00155 [Candidatus Wildermuthbacteria bacterium]|nr:hypothetical protein [Candidatus Wildermuthbacteria bacterium]
MKTDNILLFVLTGAVLLVVGFLAGSFFSNPRPQGDNPETIIKEWRGSAAGTIKVISESSVTLENEGARVVIALTPQTEVSKSNIDEKGVEQLTPITLQDLQKGNRISVAVVLAQGQLRAEAIRVLEGTQ